MIRTVIKVLRSALPLATCVLALAALTSCVQLSLQNADSIADEATVSFSIDWSAAEQALSEAESSAAAPQSSAAAPQSSRLSLPDSVKIALNHISDPARYLFTVDSRGAFPDTTARTASFGDYILLAYTTEGDDYSLSGLEGFPEKLSASIRGFKATVKDLPNDELSSLRDGSLLDFNASYRFIRTPSEPLYTAFENVVVSDTRENAYRIMMTPLMQRIIFAVTLHSEEGISIRKVVAEVSGVPASVSLLSGETSEDDIARVIFQMTPGESGEYTAEVLVPGLFPSGNVKLNSGPGIFRLAITATKGGETKVLRPAINIGDIITSAGLMETIPSTGGQKIARTFARLDVPGQLTVDSDSFTSGSLGEGVEGWFDSGKLDVEI